MFVTIIIYIYKYKTTYVYRILKISIVKYCRKCVWFYVKILKPILNRHNINFLTFGMFDEFFSFILPSSFAAVTKSFKVIY